RTTAAEIQAAAGRNPAALVARRQAAAAADVPSVSVAIVPAARECAGASRTADVVPVPMPLTAGAWRHVDAPRAVPAWIECGGFAGTLVYFRHTAGAADADASLLVR